MENSGGFINDNRSLKDCEERFKNSLNDPSYKIFAGIGSTNLSGFNNINRFKEFDKLENSTNYIYYTD